MAHLYVNNLNTVLTGAIDNIVTTINVNSTTNFPVMGVGDWFYMTISAIPGNVEVQWEIVKVTGYTATSITCVRAQDGTTAKNWDANSSISCRVAAGDMATLDAFKDSKGVANGLASLGADGKLTATEIPTIINADKLKVARAITLSGDVTGSATFDGSADSTITATVVDDSHSHSTATITGWPATVNMTEVNYLSNVTSDIQTQLNSKSSTSHTHTIDALSDVVITAVATNQQLKFDGTNWVNYTPAAITHGSLTGLGTDDHTQYYNQTRGDARYSQLGHTHTISNITDWPVAVTMLEVSYIDGVTSSVQTQLNGKAATSHTHTISNITDWPVAVSVTELGYLDGVTSGIQSQLDTKSATTHNHTLDSLSNVTITTLGVNQMLKWDGLKWVNFNGYDSPTFAGIPTVPTATAGTDTTQIASTAFVLANSVNTLSDLGVTASSVELNYSVGVTSGIQAQINSKAPLASPALTGTPTAPTAAANTNTTQLATTAFVEAATAPAQLLTDIKTVDGTGSGLDADLLDGLDSTGYYKKTDPISSSTYKDVSASVTYNTNGSVATSTSSDGVDTISLAYTYNTDGTVNTITITKNTLTRIETYIYTSGKFTSMSATGDII